MTELILLICFLIIALFILLFLGIFLYKKKTKRINSEKEMQNTTLQTYNANLQKTTKSSNETIKNLGIQLENKNMLIDKQSKANYELLAKLKYAISQKEYFQNQHANLSRAFNDSINDYNKKLKNYEEAYKIKLAEVEAIKKNYIEKEEQLLFKHSRMDKETFENHLFQYFEEKYRSELSKRYDRIQNKLEEQSEEKAKEIISASIRNLCNSQFSPFIKTLTTTIIIIKNLENWKGKIIGREGKNQRVFERELGVTFDFPPKKGTNPDQLVICNYDPVNREIAKIALQFLIKTNSFNIASIQNAIKIARTKIKKHLINEGSQALRQVGIDSDFPEELKLRLGQLSLNYSYGQNILFHSIEVAIMAKKMAKELNLNSKTAALCGLFHDIGKAQGRNTDHVIEGEKIVAPYLSVLPNEVRKVIVDHHNKDAIPESIYTVIVVSADSISAGRPGVRKQNEQIVFERLKKLEDLCKSIDGINDVKVLRSGHELWVYVDSKRIGDKDLNDIASQLKSKIKDYGKIPGTINVTIYREVESKFIINK